MKATATRAALTVAAVYGYFLLFAQFSFVELMRAGGLGIAAEKSLLACMAVAGVASGFLTARRGPGPGIIRAALTVAATGACLAGSVPGVVLQGVAAVATGAALGAATVSLAALLPSWCGLLTVGIGTGLAYAACNLPAVFQSPPVQQAWISAAMAVIGALAVPSTGSPVRGTAARILPTPSVLLLFTALVWMDSAAFFIIQHAGDLKSGTWGSVHLWRNAALHLVAAIASGCLLSRWPKLPPLLGWLLLAVAALAVNASATRGLAGWLYPPAVSLYSVALVAWPGWFSGAGDSRSAAWRAAWLFAIAGWFGSANGIGMAETLQRVPVGFIAAAGGVVVLSMILADLRQWRSALAVGIVIMAGAVSLGPSSPPEAAAERGRIVYLSEGCIHCHSRYPRPGSPDEAIWGRAPDPDAVLTQEPVLIGNRRHGPDLANVGARRSAAWLKAHFLDPRALVPGSTMPTFAHLFEDARGDDLIRFLQESGIHEMNSLIARQQAWVPAEGAAGGDGPGLFSTHCAACHGESGEGGGPLAGSLRIRPTDLRHGPFIRTGGANETPLQIARIIKFGVIGSDMPGHETLSDAEIVALADLLASWRQK